jgi:FkbM family methyltransferase
MVSTDAAQIGADDMELQSKENRLFSFLSGRIRCKHMIDVGAHHGSVLEPFLLAGWKVDAFEPVKENRDGLMRKFGSAPNLRVFGEALSNSSGVKELHLALNNDGTLHEFYHSFEELPEDDFHRKGPVRHVKATTLDNLVTEGQLESQVGLLKIDTEGHDLKVLEAASKLDCSVISVEFWNEGHPLGRSPSPPDQIVELLTDRGYPYYVAVAHEPAGDSFYYSSAGFSASSWGNIFFFQTNEKELYDECVELCTLIGGTEEGLFNMVSLLGGILPGHLTFVDVGACRGAFAAMVLGIFPGARGLLFEPTSSNYKALSERFRDNRAVRVFNSALGEESGEKEFYAFDRSENNSLLRMCGDRSPREQRTIQVDTLDRFLEKVGTNWRIDFIKTDTQGTDLRVLQGGKATLEKFRPAVLIESIFVPLYEGQDSYFSILRFMEDLKYRLAGIHNAHYTSDHILAFADLLFLSDTLYKKFALVPSNLEFICDDPLHLSEQVKFLQETCRERLELIDRLSRTAEERLQLIQELTRTADERLKVIELLDAEIKRTSKLRTG